MRRKTKLHRYFWSDVARENCKATREMHRDLCRGLTASDARVRLQTIERPWRAHLLGARIRKETVLQAELAAAERLTKLAQAANVKYLAQIAAGEDAVRKAEQLGAAHKALRELADSQAQLLKVYAARMQSVENPLLPVLEDCVSFLKRCVGYFWYKRKPLPPIPTGTT